MLISPQGKFMIVGFAVLLMILPLNDDITIYIAIPLFMISALFISQFLSGAVCVLAETIIERRK